jgi:hypothetical protein
MRLLKPVLTAVAFCVLASASQSQQEPMSDSAYTAQAPVSRRQGQRLCRNSSGYVPR